MIYKPKGRRYYKVKFQWNGQLIHRCTRATNEKTARNIEAKIRSELASGNWGILTPKVVPALSDFLKKDFLPFTKTKFESKPKTTEYYSFGVKRLLSSDLGRLKLDEITDQHAAQFAAKNSTLSPSTINCGLRTLRRALNLAYQWGKLDRAPRITLAKGERQRDRVLNREEAIAYLDVCPQPWRDLATIMLGTGMRPGELYELRWENVILKDDGGLIRIVAGKSRAARRVLPLIVPKVRQVLRTRHENQECPREGWVFPSGSACGHLEEGTAKGQHDRALGAIERASNAHERWSKKKLSDDWDQYIASGSGLDLTYVRQHASVIKNGLQRFEPYCLRHTCLTWLAESGCDAFTLARIAGHSSITITQRYCHPQADAIERAFGKMTEGQRVVTDGGHRPELEFKASEMAATTA
jgi:integrase